MFIGGFFWALMHQGWISHPGFRDQSMLQYAQLDGHIASIPTVSTTKTQFQFAVVRLNGQPVQSTILLSCYKDCPKLSVGQYWQVSAKLRQARNYRNPGGFDYVSWLHARHIQWIGTTKSRSFKLYKRSSKPPGLLALRQKMAETLLHFQLNEDVLGILQALSLGITTHISQSEWDLFRRTGTTHLMVISGAHIGLIAGLGFLGTKWLWCRFGALCLRIPAVKVAAFVAIAMSFSYAMLAGFAVPAQRSFLSCFLMFLRYFLNQKFSHWQTWRYALLLTMLWEPHVVLLPGFYLSFIAVAILMIMSQRIRTRGIRKTIAIQLGCLFGLMPLTLYWFSYGAMNGFFANLLAIPWVGFVIVPLSLITTILGQWFELSFLVVILTHSIRLLLHYLTWIDSFAFMNLTMTYAQIISPLALILAMCLGLFLPLRPLMPVTIILILIGFFPKYPKVKTGEVQIDILDVGQGLAIVVQTASHQLIYDTGLKFFQGSDMGKLVIIPYLSSLGIKTLDKVIISHPDLDHRGGLNSIAERFNVKTLIVDNPIFYQRGYACHRYPDWTWDGVSFHFFPITADLKSKNNTSCVLQIKNQFGSMLLTGDIETLAEKYLVTTYGEQLKSTMMTVPHHGSKTSSTGIFLNKVAPIYAMASYALDNRYHFPHVSVTNRYAMKQIKWLNTVDCGMIRVVLGRAVKQLEPRCYRD